MSSENKPHQNSPTAIPPTNNSNMTTNTTTKPDTSTSTTNQLEPSPPNIARSNKEGITSEPQLGTKEGVEGGGMTKNKPKRKKAMRACVHCQKSHLTCGDERPCKRCVHRGLAAQCTDGQRKKAKYLLEPPTVVPTTTSVTETINHNKDLPVKINQPILAPAPVLDTNTSMNSNPYLVNPCRMDYGFFSETANLEYDVLNSMLSNTMMLDLGAYQGLPDFPLAETWSPLNELPPNTTVPSGTWPQTNREGGSGTSSDNLQLSPLLGLKDLTWQRSPDQIASSYSKVTSAHCYIKSYHYLLKYIQERMSKENVLRICRAVSQFRPSFIALFMNLTEEDLIFVEKCFQRTLLEFEKLISLSGTPTVVWRRSGEIALVGKEFSILTNWSSDELVGKTTYIYELMDDNSCVSYWEKYATHAFDNSELSVRTTCNIYDSQKRLVPCAFCFTIKRDIFDTPSMIVGNCSSTLQLQRLYGRIHRILTRVRYGSSLISSPTVTPLGVPLRHRDEVNCFRIATHFPFPPRPLSNPPTTKISPPYPPTSP